MNGFLTKWQVKSVKILKLKAMWTKWSQISPQQQDKQDCLTNYVDEFCSRIF